jgi:predicted phosphodiesterase
LIDDPRYDPTTQKQWTPLKQYQNIKDFIEPIRKKVLCACFGNHDYRLFRWGNMVQDYLCKELNIPYGTFAAKIEIKDRRGNSQYKVYLTHGRKQIGSAADDPIRVQSNMELILKRHLKNKAADCLVMVKGHTHKLLCIHPRQDLYLYDDGVDIKSSYRVSEPGTNFIHPDLRYFGNSGSAYRLFADPKEAVSSYGEIGEFDPVELGYLRLTVVNGKVVDFRKVVVG